MSSIVGIVTSRECIAFSNNYNTKQAISEKPK